MKIGIINGPNLNMLSIREPDIYGTLTYDELCKYIQIYVDENYNKSDSLEESIMNYSEKSNIKLIFFQSNGEKEIIDFIQSSYREVDGYIINPAAFTHYSIAILDAIKSVPNPFIEIHISNIYSRETIRNTSITAGACIGTISGFGKKSYTLGIDALIEFLNLEKHKKLT